MQEDRTAGGEDMSEGREYMVTGKADMGTGRGDIGTGKVHMATGRIGMATGLRNGQSHCICSQVAERTLEVGLGCNTSRSTPFVTQLL